jgi:DNA polymerase-3 subunit alpha (Gram-positive type)
LIVDEIVYEMLARGYSFCPPSLTESTALKFTIDDGKVRVPLCALENVGASVGTIIEQQREVRPYETVEDLQTRGKANKSAIESLRKHGVLEGLPESDQISFF